MGLRRFFAVFVTGPSVLVCSRASKFRFGPHLVFRRVPIDGPQYCVSFNDVAPEEDLVDDPFRLNQPSDSVATEADTADITDVAVRKESLPADKRKVVVEPANDSPRSGPIENDDEEEMEPVGIPGGLPTLPRAGAVKRLSESLRTYGLSEGAAAALARAVARPEEARRRLQSPDLMRVPGGVLETISAQVWTPAITTFPGNNRQAGDRIYPLSGALGEERYPPLGSITAQPGETGELVLTAQSPAHVISELDRAEAFLASANDLTTTVASQGILRDLLLSVMRIEHQDMTPPVYAVVADDGSSRASSAHRIHELSSKDVVYGLPGNERSYRGLIGEVTAAALLPMEELTSTQAKRARSLVAPATIILGFRPDEGSSVRYDRAVRFVVGITHVEPPKRWGSAGENDALADAVIEEFVESRCIGDSEARWFAATSTPEEAAGDGFLPFEDARVVEIAARFHPRSVQRIFRRGVLRVTAKDRVTNEYKAKITTELALRPWRSAQTDPDRVTAVRSTVQRILTWPVLAEDSWRRGTDDPDKLLAEALSDLEGQGTSGPAGVELGVRGGWYIAVYQALVRDSRGSIDQRAPYSVIQKMIKSEHGLRVLHAAIVNGRNGYRPTRVDRHGSPERGNDQRSLPVDDPWLRRNFPMEDGQGSVSTVDGIVDTPESLFERHRRLVADLVDSLESALREAETVIGRSRALVRERGWPQAQAEDLAERLSKVSGRLRLWATVAETAEESEAEEAARED
jgi:hypothetical protein